MLHVNIIPLLQQLTATTLGSIVVPVLAGIAVLYLGMHFLQRRQPPQLELDTPDQEEVMNSFLHSFFSGEWDAIETRIEMEYFKNKILQNNKDSWRAFTEKLLAKQSPYTTTANQVAFALLTQELDIHAFITQELTEGSPEQQRKAVQWAVSSQHKAAMKILEKRALAQPVNQRLETVVALLQLNEYNPQVLKNITLSEEELSQLVALYSDRLDEVREHLNTWLIASQSQLVKFCLVLAKHYQITVDSRTLQFLAFHQDKKLGALAMEILDGYLHPNQAAENLQNYRKSTLLQHQTGDTKTNPNTNLALG